MDVLIIDTAARGHIEAELAANSDLVRNVYLWPDKVLADGAIESTGLPSFEEFGNNWEVAKHAIVEFVRRRKIDCTLVTADDPIAAGLGDSLTAEGCKNFAPTVTAAEIESSKIFMKEIAASMGVPTAAYAVFEEARHIMDYAVEHNKFPVVIKADGLSAGKGVKICKDLKELEINLQEFSRLGWLGNGKQVLVEEYLEGPEISLHAWCDGETYRMFPFAMQDHKTIYDNDEGPMTGGMAVIGPVPGITAQDVEALGKQFIEPFIVALKAQGRPFKGVMYPSIKLTATGPKLLEVNARPGDPEAPACLPLLKTDFIKIVLACVEGRLKEIKDIKWRKGAAVCIALAARGYPDKTEKGAVITGIEAARKKRAVQIFDYGIEKDKDSGALKVNTGRVVAVTARGRTLNKALKRGYKAASIIRFDNERPQMRSDIGNQAQSELFRQRLKIMRQRLVA